MCLPTMRRLLQAKDVKKQVEVVEEIPSEENPFLKVDNKNEHKAG